MKNEIAETTVSHHALYSTAKATTACAMFAENEIVSVCNPFKDNNGKAWFCIKNAAVRGTLPYNVYYPENHLKEFCI